MSENGKVKEIYHTQIRVVKQEHRSRSEYTLLYELIQRNPERAVEFLRRLGYAVKQAA